METQIVRLDFDHEARCVVKGCSVTTHGWFAFAIGNLWAAKPICRQCRKDYMFGMNPDGTIQYRSK